jgi:RNA polymerase sigma-70 factor (ECF subfamily)
MLPIAANGQPAFAAYLRGDDGVHRAHAIQVLTCDGASLTRIASFNDAGLFPIFALPGIMAAVAGS